MRIDPVEQCLAEQNRQEEARRRRDQKEQKRIREEMKKKQIEQRRIEKRQGNQIIRNHPNMPFNRADPNTMGR